MAAFLVWINVVPTDIWGDGITEMMNFTASYGRPFPAVWCHWVAHFTSPPAIPTDAVWEVSVLFVTINVISGLVIMILIGAAWEWFLRRRPRLHSPTYWVLTTVAGILTIVHLAKYSGGLFPTTTALVATGILQKFLVVALPVLLLVAVFSEWLIRSTMKKERTTTNNE
jgi:hypothetical protein